MRLIAVRKIWFVYRNLEAVRGRESAMLVSGDNRAGRKSRWSGSVSTINRGNVCSCTVCLRSRLWVVGSYLEGTNSDSSACSFAKSDNAFLNFVMCSFVLSFQEVKCRWWTAGIGFSVEDARWIARAVCVRKRGYAAVAAY